MIAYKCWDVTEGLTVQYHHEEQPAISRRTFFKVNDLYVPLLHEDVAMLIGVLEQISKANQEE